MKRSVFLSWAYLVSFISNHASNAKEYLLPLCNSSNIFDGHWKYLTSNENTDSYLSADKAFLECPRTEFNIRHHQFLKDQASKYACNNYPQAHWHPRECRLLNLHETIHIFNNSTSITGGPRMTIMGDSLSGQFYIASQCTAEMRNISMDSEYILELLYRRDFPCLVDCLGDAGIEYRKNASLSTFGNSCDGCRDGFQHNLTEFQYNTPWLRMVSNTTSALVLGGGAWFNYYRGFFNSSGVYEETIRFIAPILHHLILRRKIEVYWIDLPPCWFDDGVANERLDYEWDSFSHKNAVARRILEPVGVTYLNSWPALMQRKKFNISVADEGRLHWCNPGPFSVPTFLVHAVLHLHAQRRLAASHHKGRPP